jgi:hypothetical protein
MSESKGYQTLLTGPLFGPSEKTKSEKPNPMKSGQLNITLGELLARVPRLRFRAEFLSFPQFAKEIDEATGLGEGQSINLAAKLKPELYNQYCRELGVAR